MSDTTLELESPMFSCGACHFGTCIAGEWSIEEGRLVFRASPDPQQRRGPDLDGCCEGYACGHFTKIVADTDQVFEGEQLEQLRSTAHAWVDSQDWSV
jgi:hypothetical protein